MQQQQYWPVNWIDGMKINKAHFIAQDNAFTCQVAQHTGSLITDYNYGLLPGLRNGGSDTKLQLSVDNQQQVQLRIQQCRAITRGGYHIFFEEDTALHGSNFTAPIPQLSVPFQELKGKAPTFLVILTIQPYRRIPFGAADPDETPTRLPYSTASFHLSLLPENEASKNAIGLFQLPVGRIKIEEQRVLLDDTYIPPCSTVSSHFELLDVHAGLEQFYTKMELYALQIIQKIMQRKQTNEMAIIVQRLCEQITAFTALHLAEIKSLSQHQAPAFLIHKVAALARIYKNTLDYYIGSGKEELINYFIEWCEITQGELESCITGLCNHQYDHLDIISSIDKVSVFTRLISTLFANLSKLEYIGKRRDAGIFVKEMVVSQELQAPVKTRRSFLAE